MHVKEEYLIYNTVAFISSIGGTLGLCIGFSFSNLGALLLGWMELAISEISSKFKSTKVKSLHDQPQVEMPTDRETAMSSYEQTNVSSSELVKEVVQLNEGLGSKSQFRYKNKAREIRNNHLADHHKQFTIDRFLNLISSRNQVTQTNHVLLFGV